MEMSWSEAAKRISSVSPSPSVAASYGPPVLDAAPFISISLDTILP
jgi:hypothetical protein